MTNENSSIALIAAISLIGAGLLFIFLRYLVLKKRILRRIAELDLYNNWVFLIIFIVTMATLIVYGAAGSASESRYANDIKGECHIYQYQEISGQENKIRAKVNITNSIPLYGRSKWQCYQSIHNFDQDKYEDCVVELLDKHPIGSTSKCWYNTNNYDKNDGSYLIYWNKRTVENFWLITGILLACFGVEIFIYFVPHINKFIERRLPADYNEL